MSSPAIKTRRKRNIIWNIPKAQLEFAVKNFNSLNAILIYLKLDNRSGNYRILKRRLLEDNIDFSHISLGLSSNKGRKFLFTIKKPLELILVENSNYSRASLKKRLLKEGLLINKCSKCNLEPFWEGNNLSLQLDHINGINNDNRLENLRLLCPNCHSQTSTFSGRRFKRTRINKNNARVNCRKVVRPSKEELYKLLWEIPTSKIAKQFGVSDKSIEKWCKYYKLSKPPRGYWSKKL